MELDSGFGDHEGRAQRIARLSTLQRLRDQAAANQREKMLATINDMIEAELRAMGTRGRDAEPQQ